MDQIWQKQATLAKNLIVLGNFEKPYFIIYKLWQIYFVVKGQSHHLVTLFMPKTCFGIELSFHKVIFYKSNILQNWRLQKVFFSSPFSEIDISHQNKKGWRQNCDKEQLQRPFYLRFLHLASSWPFHLRPRSSLFILADLFSLWKSHI